MRNHLTGLSNRVFTNGSLLPAARLAGKRSRHTTLRCVWAVAFIFGCAGSACKKRPNTAKSMMDRMPGAARVFELVPGVAVEFRWIPPGLISSAQSDAGQQVAGTPRRIAVEEGFWMATHETTMRIWQLVMNSGQDEPPAEDKNLPVSEVSWVDCQEFIARLSPLVGGLRWRLPSEVQWEYACRAGSATEFYGEPESIAWLDSNSDGYAHPVGLLTPNAWGLLDMHGNVAEWCCDASGQRGGERIIRGGSWDSDLSAQASVRNSDTPNLKINRVGFRLIIDHSVL
jgi:formylglycine-generating enzyme required for sulfatase activity